MAEAMEFDFSLPSNEGKKFDPELVEKVKKIQQEANGKTQTEEIPEAYRIENYYTDDELGADVLKNKYLAPWENHPWEIWKRQASALSSVEKNKKLQKKWEAKFFSILEDFKFVPGGRIMHGAGREDITTTLNNCYVMAIKDDAIDEIYKTVTSEALTYKYGGGCGHDLSVLRPSGESINGCLLYTSPSPRDRSLSRMPSSA